MSAVATDEKQARAEELAEARELRARRRTSWLIVSVTVVALGLVGTGAAVLVGGGEGGVNAVVKRYLDERGVDVESFYTCNLTGNSSDGAKLYWCNYSVPAPCDSFAGVVSCGTIREDCFKVGPRGVVLTTASSCGQSP